MVGKFSRYYVNVTKWRPTREEWLWLCSSIPHEEVDRVNKFVYQDDAKSSLIGQALIRAFISQSTGIPSNHLELTRSERGRPEVVRAYKDRVANWPKVLDFNVSHSGDYCVLAGIRGETECPDLTVGVDVTRIVKKNTKPELDRFLQLMSKRQFTSSEWETVEEVSSDRQKCVNFTRLWCLKESFIKSNGLGLAFGLNRISFIPETSTRYNLNPEHLIDSTISGTEVLVDDRLAPDWKFLETALDKDHLVAIGYNLTATTDWSSLSPIDSSAFMEFSIDSLVKALSPIDPEDEENWSRFRSRSLKG